MCHVEMFIPLIIINKFNCLWNSAFCVYTQVIYIVLVLKWFSHLCVLKQNDDLIQFMFNHFSSLFHSLWNIQLSLSPHWMSGCCCFYGNGTSIMSKHQVSCVYYTGLWLWATYRTLLDAVTHQCTELSSSSHLQNFHIEFFWSYALLCIQAFICTGIHWSCPQIS